MNSKLQTFLGIATFFLGIVLGLTMGIWVLFMGGIIQIVQSIIPEVHAFGIALGIVRIMFAAPVGWVIFILMTGISQEILH